jgi:diguanylate cyclase (GGDEF)-like protein/PAS domain S-box-containing protein
MIALLALLAATPVQAGPAAAEKHVLIVNSYHRGFAWSDAEELGFVERLQQVYPTADVSIEFLDTKHYPDAKNLKRMKEFLVDKYRGRKVDLVVVFDNPALDMFAQHKNELFPQVPVIFAGVSDFEQSLLKGRKRVTGVVEMQDVKNTIEMALAFHPGTMEVLIVNDETISGISLRREVESLAPVFSRRVKFHFLAPSTFEEVRAKIGSLPPDTIVLITSFSTDRQGRTLSLSESTRIFTSSAKVPVYGVHETRLGHGIVGGSLLGGKDHGRRAAEIALRVLAGEEPAAIPVDTTGTARPMFDALQLKRFGIVQQFLPVGSIIVNAPESIFTKYREWVVGAVMIIMILGTMVAFLAAAIARRKRMEKALIESEQRLRTMAEASFEGIALSENGILQDVNDQLASMLGYERSDLIGRHVMQCIAPEHRDLVSDAIRSGQLEPYENQLICKDGTKILVESRARNAQLGARQIRLTAIRDITDRKRADQVLRFTRFAMDRMTDQSFWITSDGKFVYVNDAACRSLGYSREELLGMSVTDIDPGCTPDMFAKYWRILKENGSDLFEVHHHAKDGRVYPVEIRSNYFVFDGKEYNCAFATDITKRKEAERHIHKLAFYDPLTGLPNRTFYKELLNRALEHARRHDTIMAVLFIDLDNFKRINDLLGHDMGDRLLRQVSEAISSCVRKSDYVAYSEEGDGGNIISRLGGDEFIVLLTEISSSSDVARIAQRILEELAFLDTVEGHEVVVSASIGIALFPEDGLDAESLLKNADIAMYHAKSSGRKCYQFYTASMHARSLERMQLENKLHKALEKNEFMLLFQPTISALQRNVVGIEALIRWHPADCGLLAQSEFIALAEETGLIMPIGQWVLNTACTQHRAWQKLGIGPLKVSVNLSCRQFDHQNIREMVSQALQGADLDARYLELEITESAIMRNPEKAAATLRQLKNMGISIALDDFGTGYSSLAHLRRFPLDALKIDRSFVMNITTSIEDVAIVKAIIAMAHGLKLRVVAEGVESKSQLVLLQGLGCDEFQGFLFSQPLPSADTLECLRKEQYQYKPPIHSAGNAAEYSIESVITHVQKFQHFWSDGLDKPLDVQQGP